MPAQPFNTDENQLGLFEYQAALFDRDIYEVPDLEPEPSEVPDPEPDELAQIAGQLGFDRSQKGRIARAEFTVQVARMGGSCSTPDGDPGGGTRSDVGVAFPGRLFSVQVKGRTIGPDGKVHFDLGPRDGDRKYGYIGRAQLFALAVFNQDTVITDWYLIPAVRLRRRVKLTVMPGRPGWRKRKDSIEPERYRNAWHELLGVPLSSEHGTRMSSGSRPGT
jgi:hypothetical protein